MSIDLNDKIPGAPDFRYGEFVKSATALRKGIDNTPGPREWINIEILAKFVLQPVRNQFGSIIVNSGFRSAKLNRAVGGSTRSLHLKGYAADIEPLDLNISLFEVLRWIYYHAPFTELIAEWFPTGWVHVGYKHGYNARVLKLADKEHLYEVVDINYVTRLYGG